MDLNDRIKKTRIDAGLSQRSFGKVVGISGASINRLESGENNPSEQTLKLIATNFKVNFEWLKFGTGPERLDVSDDEVVEELMAGSNEYAKSIMKAFAKLGEEEWAMLKKGLDMLKSGGL